MKASGLEEETLGFARFLRFFFQPFGETMCSLLSISPVIVTSVGRTRRFIIQEFEQLQ